MANIAGVMKKDMRLFNRMSTLAKMAELPKILEAAHVLKRHGLIDEEPTVVVKRYVQANPDINQALADLPHNAGVTGAELAKRPC